MIKGKFLPDTPTEEYTQTSSGESHKAKTADKFCGPTKGNTDLPPNRTVSTPGGYGGGQHKAGGMGKKKMAY